MSRVMYLDIQRRVCARFGLSRAELIGPCKERRFARPRQVAMYLGRTVAGRSFTQLGYYTGRRHHTTVIAACRRIEGLCAATPQFSAAIEKLAEEIAA